jgi:hypothetical protein
MIQRSPVDIEREREKERENARNFRKEGFVAGGIAGGKGGGIWPRYHKEKERLLRADDQTFDGQFNSLNVKVDSGTGSVSRD